MFVHQFTYTKRVLEKFNMSKCHPLKTSMVVRSLDVDKDPFGTKGDNKEVLGPEVPYLSAIGALMYLANCTRPDIAFAVNLLARYSAAPTRRHWVGIKTMLRYLQETQEIIALWWCSHFLAVCKADPSCHIDQPLRDNRSIRGCTRVCLVATND